MFNFRVKFIETNAQVIGLFIMWLVFTPIFVVWGCSFQVFSVKRPSKMKEKLQVKYSRCVTKGFVDE
jgi:hypothetical protein